MNEAGESSSASTHPNVDWGPTRRKADSRFRCCVVFVYRDCRGGDHGLGEDLSGLVNHPEQQSSQLELSQPESKQVVAVTAESVIAFPVERSCPNRLVTAGHRRFRGRVMGSCT